MTVLIFYTRNRGYLSQFYEDLSVRLTQDGHQVNNFSLKSRKYAENENNVLLKVEKSGGYLKNYYEVFKIINKVKPDVILSNFSYVNPALLFGKLLGVKHNMIWFHTLKKQMNFKPSNIYIKSKFMNLASTIITNSKELKQEVIADYRQEPRKVYNFPFTTTVAATAKKEINLVKRTDQVYIGCPGRLHPDKNQNLLIDVLFDLKDENLVLVLAGSTQSDFIEIHKNYPALKNRIILLGNLSPEEMVDFYNKMDVIVLPSLNEAFGLVLIEALASGCNTLVSSRFGALDYIKDDVSSITFNPNDLEDLKDKLMEALVNKKPPQYFKDLYENNFSMDEIVKRFLLLIENKKANH